MDINSKKKALAQQIERVNNSFMRCIEVGQEELALKWLNMAQGLEDAFKIVFGQKYIDYWMEEMEAETIHKA